MRLGILMNLAPRKLGSFEGWIVAVCERARSLGHEVDVFGRLPAQPQFLSRLAGLGAGWDTLDALQAQAVPGIRRLRSYDALHLNMLAPRSPLALMSYAAYPARVVFVDHTSGPIPGEARAAPPWVALFSAAADSLTLVRVDGVIGVSEYVADRFRRRFRFAKDRVQTIYNGVDLSRFFAKDEYFALPEAPALAPARLKVAAVAHLIRHKGVHHLIRAVALARAPLELTVVGDGPERAALESLARELAVVDRVRFVGLRDDVHALVASCDAFVHPAVWEEAFGLTIAEAMACGRAVVATRIGAIPELIDDGVNGLLVPPGDERALAAALDRLSAGHTLRAELGRSARAKAERYFGVQRCADQHVKYCEGAVARARPRLHP